MSQSLFKFEVLDQARGKVRRGTLRSSSLEAARSEIEDKGYSIVLLEPMAEMVSFQRSREPSLSYELTFWERFSIPQIPKSMEVIILTLLVLLGCLFLGKEFWTRDADDDRDRIHKLARTERKITIEGRFRKAPSDGTILRVRFPQLPYELKSDFGVVATGDGGFLWEIPFKSHRTPSHCDFKVERDGRVVLSRNSVLLTGKAMRANLNEL